jgi:hypothetical protein
MDTVHDHLWIIFVIVSGDFMKKCCFLYLLVTTDLKANQMTRVDIYRFLIDSNSRGDTIEACDHFSYGMLLCPSRKF